MCYKQLLLSLARAPCVASLLCVLAARVFNNTLANGFDNVNIFCGINVGTQSGVGVCGGWVICVERGVTTRRPVKRLHEECTVFGHFQKLGRDISARRLSPGRAFRSGRTTTTDRGAGDVSRSCRRRWAFYWFRPARNRQSREREQTRCFTGGWSISGKNCRNRGGHNGARRNNDAWAAPECAYALVVRFSNRTSRSEPVRVRCESMRVFAFVV